MENLKTIVLRLFKPNATDETWDYFGEKCPYFGVVNWQQFKPENFDAKAREEFFQTGRHYMEWVLGFIRKKIDPDFHPAKSADFGCGVGRLLVPIARESASAVGIEISTSMIEEAAANCQLAGVQNVQFVKTVSELDSSRGTFDFVNSFIVFQHIPPKRGYEIFEQLVLLLQEGGIGALHLTFCDPGRRRGRYLDQLYRWFPFLFAVRNILIGCPPFEPRTDMAEYSLNKLFRILHEKGCHLVYTVATKHGLLGTILIFQKAKTDML